MYHPSPGWPCVIFNQNPHRPGFLPECASWSLNEGNISVWPTGFFPGVCTCVCWTDIGTIDSMPHPYYLPWSLCQILSDQVEPQAHTSPLNLANSCTRPLGQAILGPIRQVTSSGCTSSFCDRKNHFLQVMSCLSLSSCLSLAVLDSARRPLMLLHIEIWEVLPSETDGGILD